MIDAAEAIEKRTIMGVAAKRERGRPVRVDVIKSQLNFGVAHLPIGLVIISLILYIIAR